MIAVESECGAGCEAWKAEGDLMGLGSEGDLMGLGDRGRIVRGDGAAVGGSFGGMDRDSDDRLDGEGDSDPEEKGVVPLLNVGSAVNGVVAAGDQEVSSVMAENGELCIENGHDHEDGLGEEEGVNGELPSEAASDLIKQQPELETSARAGEDGKLCEENGVDGELREVGINQESHVTGEENGACCEVNEESCNGAGELCRDEEERELGFENSRDQLEELASAVEEKEVNGAVGERIQQAEVESDVEVEEAQEPETVVTETYPEEEPESESANELVEEHKASTGFTDTEDQREPISAVVEKQEPKALVVEISQPEELESATELVEEHKARIEFADSGNLESLVTDEDNGACCEVNGESCQDNGLVELCRDEEKRELGFENGRDQLEGLASAVEEKEVNAAVRERIQQAAVESDVEVDKTQEPVTVVTETYPEEEPESESATESVEERKASTGFTDTEDQREPISAVEEKQEPKALVVEISQPEELESATELVEEYKARIGFADSGNLREPESAVKVEEKQDLGPTVATTTDPAETESDVEAEEKQQPYCDVTKVDRQEEPKSVYVGEVEIQITVREANGHAECESVEPQEKQEAHAAVAHFDERIEVESVDMEEKQETHDPEESESVVHVEEKQDIEVVVSETDDCEELKPLVKETNSQAKLKSTDELELRQQPETVVVETEVMKEEETREPEDALVESEVLDGDEEREPSIVIAETMAFEPIPVENEVVGNPNGAADVSIEPSIQLGMLPEGECETILESGDGKESSNCMKSTAELSDDSFDNGVMPTNHVDVQLDSEARIDPLESLSIPRSCDVDGKAMVNGTAFVDDESCRTDQSVPSGPKVDIPIDVAELSPLDPANDMGLKPELVNSSNGSGIEVESGLVESGASDNAELKDHACDGIASFDKDIYIGKIKLAIEVNDTESMTSSFEGDRSTSRDDDEEPTRLEGIQPSHEEPSGLASDGERLETHAIKRQPCFMIRIPRFSDDELRTKIQDADILLKEKTRSRVSKGVEIQKQMAIVAEHEKKLQDAKRKVGEARAAVGAKRKELDSVQSRINNMKNASSVVEIDDKIHKMEHMLQHETIPTLAQEKQYMREIKHLRHRRDQISSMMGPPEEILEAFDQRDKVEEQFKTLKKELDPLRNAILRAEGDVRTASEKHDHQIQLLNGLREQFEVAHGICQDADAHLHNLKKESYNKSKHFFKYKDDQQTAGRYVFSGDREALQTHCNQQMERIMEAWNNNEEFRKQYVKYNMKSTLRRFGTLDGRSLGPGEEPPVVHTFVDRNSSNIHVPLSSISAPVPVLDLEVKEGSLGAQAGPKRVQPTNQLAKSKNSASQGAFKPTVPHAEEVIKEAEKEIKITKEEEELAREAEELARKDVELARMEEELRKEKAAIELRAQLRLEQRAKAKEAEERKRRRAEKAQAKAEYKAQKEAELREKKRAKKEKKKAGSVNGANGGDEEDSVPVVNTVPTETTKEPKTVVTTASRRSSRPPVAVKQYNKIQPLPLPLRNRGKRKMQTWMWVFLTTLLVAVLFFAGNYVSFYQFTLPSFRF